ncbi:MAG TPA: hypothetical protein VHK65_10020 [Candidatus Dormibacteraeota bacterium]|nr:hypothetical protein [Candidatus Dormibacteraeota bacterium]
MHGLETILALSRSTTIALAKFLAFTGLAATASLVQLLGSKQKKSPSTVTSVTLLAAGAYTAALTGGLVLGFSTGAWRVPVGLGLMLLGAGSVFKAQRMWRHPAPARPVGSSSNAIAAQTQGPVETVWLKAASAGPDDAVWPQLIRLTSPRDAEALIASPDFLAPNEHLLYRTRLFFGRAIPEMADASVVVTEARLLITDGQQVFTIPRARIQAIAYREKEPMALRAKAEAIVFTYATESAEQELAGFDPGVFFWSGQRGAKTHKTFEALRDALTSRAQPPAAA